ncbi:heavy metal transport/detoxification protein [bacterium]|nr:heavy metal transport/detoxification protein [bacterium]
MKKTFKVNNISCSSCVNLIKGSLEDDFGHIDIDLSTTPKEVTVEIENNEKENFFKKEMSEIGFDIIE